jgi:hypothetical protein
MVMKTLLSLSLLVICLFALGQPTELLTRYEKSNFTEAATYEEVMTFYRALDQRHDIISIKTHGPTDSGIPLHVVMLNTGKETDPMKIHASGKVLLLINNGIHPGEPDGISACQLLLRELAGNPKKYKHLLDKVALAVIPVYNIGGALNRNSTTRVNQNGPEEYGFRGNAKNYDLNRDFIKTDSKNSRSFQALYQQLDPDIFLDTHVSNGADYQYIMTLLFSQQDKLGGVLGAFMTDEFMPYSYTKMKEKGFPATPYVNVFGSTPDKGWQQFIDWPRFSSGYATLFHSMSVVSETHMLKTYKQRVEATYAYLNTLLEFAAERGTELVKVRNQTKQQMANQRFFELSWELDTTFTTPLNFMGYEAEYPQSEVTGLPRLKYNREKPFTKTVSYSNKYQANLVVEAPKAYLIPQQWSEVIDLLKLNNVEMKVLSSDTTLSVEAYRIADYKSFPRAYEGHFKHYNVQVTPFETTVKCRKGDVLVPVNQWRNRYIVETLEPHAPDSYFSWNFFDTILQQKEYFSGYVFEDTALEILRNDPELKRAFDDNKATDPEFAANAGRQLDFIYQRSQHLEAAYMRYPIYRLK